jgi:hypothetical protein
VAFRFPAFALRRCHAPLSHTKIRQPNAALIARNCLANRGWGCSSWSPGGVSTVGTYLLFECEYSTSKAKIMASCGENASMLCSSESSCSPVCTSRLFFHGTMAQLQGPSQKFEACKLETMIEDGFDSWSCNSIGHEVLLIQHARRWNKRITGY